MAFIDVNKKVRKLSKNQLFVFDLHLKGRSYTSLATSSSMKLKPQALGGVMSSLTRNKLIEMAGRTADGDTQWMLTKPVEQKKAELVDLVNRIMRVYDAQK